MRAQRIERLYEYILEHQTVSLDTLCEEFEVSRNTIRRDLSELMKRGSLTKIYGGVTVAPPPGSSMDTVPFEERNIKNSDAKMRLARQAAALVQDGDVIFIDSGSTAGCFYSCLPKNLQLTIFTNNIEILIKSTYENDFRVLATGGQLARKTYSMVGADAARMLANYNIDKAFLSATAVSLDRGATNSSEGEYVVKKAVMKSSTSRYLLVDKSKFDRVSLLTYATLDEMDAVITDGPPPEAYVDYFDRRKIKLIVASDN